MLARRPTPTPRRLTLVAVLVAALSAAGPPLGTPAAASGVTPAIGPPLETPPAALATALECGPEIDRPGATPVLLVHGTSSTPEESWAFGYRRVLPLLGHPTCTVRLPQRAWGDIQTSTEYVVAAIRTMAVRSGRRVSVLGHSQGDLQPLWALRFWPDLTALVDDYVGLAAPLRGTVAAGVVCALPGRCPPAVWQFRAGAEFNAALTRMPLPAGPSYTAIATLLDELVVPQPAASMLPGVSTVVVQRLCPGRIVEHAGLLGDAAAFAVVMDALGHAGAALLSRVDRRACLRATMPGIDLPGYLAALPVLVAHFAATALATSWVTAEPPIRPYASTG